MPDRSSLLGALGASIVTCTAGVSLDEPVVLALGAVALAAASVLALAFAPRAWAHRRLTRELLGRSARAELAGTPVRVGPHGRSVFVAGLGRPEIFCDDALAAELTGAELRAVTLHERAHQLARDPLRMTLVAAIAPAVSQVAPGRAWLTRTAARREIAADGYALAHGASRSAIASALLKVAPAGPAHVVGFTPATDLRLRALLGDDVDAGSHRRWPWLLGGALVGIAACGALLHPAVSLLS